MVRHYITFKPATGKFEKAILPYKKWYQVTDMSLPIEVDGNYYRILRTTGPIDRLGPKKLVVCNEDGELIKDKEISRKCFRFYVYIGNYEFDKRKLKADLKQDGAKRYNPIIPEYQKMMKDLTPVLNEHEMEALEYHLFYFREMVRITTLRIELAEKLMLYKEQIQPGNIDEITNSTVTKVIDTFSKWIKCSYELEALLHEDGLLARDTVRGILKNTEKHKYIGNMAIAREIISDLDSGEATARRFIPLENEQRKELRKWIDLEEMGKEVSSIEIYIKELRYTKTAEILANAALEELMSTLWVFS
ncbi:hypothetical protein KQI49_10585 [Virgibacillus sp. MSJ-26]|uniref:hypothetical protein n=1 Tax=Virgibacillus sp. MSJ-26 TaxID=2841522 RepID=UPI001C102F25|nr:hypothetical protein [Virgibacillus sp. MSJ-26]MBU5467268.1 hypothetical protein [Virgibacillus sp. MSJ-26]